MNNVDFSFSDLIAGYVTSFTAEKGDFGTFELETTDGRNFEVTLTSETYAELVRNLGDAYHDCNGRMQSMLTPNRYLFVHGIFYPEADERKFEAQHLVFLGNTAEEYSFEQPDWWCIQIKELADFYLKSQFKDGITDYRQYRTSLGLSGNSMGTFRQETDTISRLVYGFASAYMLTGEDRYLEAAEKGSEYLRNHMRFLDDSEELCYWYHAVDVHPDGSESKFFTSEFGDDYQAIPAYEQIYALAGLTQTYRVTGDRQIKRDIELTLNLFERHFLDKSDHGGFFSHIDPVTLSPYSESLGRNRAKKNWNSVGDHAPAYLINLWLATGEEKYANLLEDLFDIIEKHFPDDENSPFVQERFNEDWSQDKTWGWQQDRAVVGHNLKIAWNLARMYHLKPKEAYLNLAEKIAQTMPDIGSDTQRGGWYDVVERVLKPGQEIHRRVWHDRKAWWQQEQVILAYQILSGSLGNPEYHKLGREVTAFYNAWFLDHNSGGVYFNVLADGIPYLLDNERGKGSHSMSGYHAFELAYLGCVYNNLLITKQPIDLYFKPKPGSFEDNILRVAPDMLPPGSIRIEEVWLNGRSHYDFDPENLTIKLPPTQEQAKVRVRLLPTQLSFSASLLEITENTAKISLSGLLDENSVPILEQEVEKATRTPIKRIVLLLENLKCVSTAGLRGLIFIRQKLGSNVDFYVVGAGENIKSYLKNSEFYQSVTIVDSYDSWEKLAMLKQ